MRNALVVVFLACLGSIGRAESEPSPGASDRPESPDAQYAKGITEAWKFAKGRNFVKIIENTTIGEVSPCFSHQAVVIAVLDGQRQLRVRGASGNFLDTSHLDAGYAATLGLDALNRGMKMFETVTGRSLYRFRIIPMEVPCRGLERAYAIWNVSSGDLFLDQQYLQSTFAYFSRKGDLLTKFGEALPHQMQLYASNSTHQEGWARLHHLVSHVAPAALAAAASSQIPLWFCIACPVVLGLLAPFVFNAGFGSAAGLICQHYQLPSEECDNLWASLVRMPVYFGQRLSPEVLVINPTSQPFGAIPCQVNACSPSRGNTIEPLTPLVESKHTLCKEGLEVQWYGAFALAMILSIASAIPIVYICQLQKCARQG